MQGYLLPCTLTEQFWHPLAFDPRTLINRATDTREVQRPDSTKISDDWDTFWTPNWINYLDNSILDNSTPPNNIRIWTGISSNGTPNSNNCNNWTSNTVPAFSRLANPYVLTDRILYTTTGMNCNNSSNIRLYCVSF